MRIEHIAVTSNSTEDSDKFFISLLNFKKTRTFSVSSDLMKQFFGINKEYEFIRYENENFSVEVIISNDSNKTKDIFTHSCFVVKDIEDLIKRANKLGFQTIKVPRKGTEGYYYFIKDFYNNLYELKV